MSTIKAPAVQPPKRFDPAKFESMIEPFNVRVDRIKGSAKYEIPLPTSESGDAPGTGWAKNQVREMQTWLVNEWAGGGHYSFAITDSSPVPQTMEWNAYYPPTEFPERLPPGLQGAFNPQPVAGAPQQQQQMRLQPMAQFPGSGSSLPPAALYAIPGQMPQPMPMPAPQGYYPQMPVQYGYSTPIAAVQPNTEVTALREALAQAREAGAQREFERRLAESEAKSERRFAELQTTVGGMVKELTDAMKVQQMQRPSVDPIVESLKEQMRLQADQLRKQEEINERTRREAELREQIKSSQDAMTRLIEESNRRFETFMATNANKGPDPQMMMFQTIMQNQMEAMKEVARTSQSQLDRMQNNVLRPQDIIAITKDSASSAEHTAAGMARQWEQMFGISRQLIEQAAQMNQGGGGNEVVSLVRDGIDKLGDWAGKYTGGKSRETVAQATAQADIAKAQAQVQTAQLERMADLARMEQAQRHGTAVQMPDGSFRAAGVPPQALPASGGGLNGTNGTNGSAMPWRTPKTPRTDAAPAAPAQASNVVPIRQPINEGRRIKGRTDLEWFGPILHNVNELRAEVAAFIKGLEAEPRVKAGATPEECSSAIQIAAAEIMQRQIPIPAMVELLIQGMTADFLDVLLPDAPQAYRDDVVKLLMGEELAPPKGEADPDDNDDDDDDDPDDAKDDPDDAKAESPQASA